MKIERKAAETAPLGSLRHTVVFDREGDYAASGPYMSCTPEAAGMATCPVNVVSLLTGALYRWDPTVMVIPRFNAKLVVEE